MQKRLLLSVRHIVFIFAGLSFSFTSQVAEAREHRLLIINSYNEAAPWSQELITPIAIENGLRFAIREGGRTVGSGVVTKINE